MEAKIVEGGAREVVGSADASIVVREEPYRVFYNGEDTHVASRNIGNKVPVSGFAALSKPDARKGRVQILQPPGTTQK